MTSKKVIFAGSFAGVAALIAGLAAFQALSDSDELGDAAPTYVTPGRQESDSSGSTLGGTARRDGLSLGVPAPGFAGLVDEMIVLEEGDVVDDDGGGSLRE